MLIFLCVPTNEDFFFSKSLQDLSQRPQFGIEQTLLPEQWKLIPVLPSGFIG